MASDLKAKMPSSPPESGILHLTFPIAPVSHQSTGARKASVRRVVRTVLAESPYVLIDDVKLSIEWLINAHERYESDGAADVDNIVKPILDAMCGSHGILIDDCQVQQLDVLWRDRYDAKEFIEIELRFDPDAWMLKDDLLFLRLQRGLVFPLSNRPREMVIRHAAHISEIFNRRDQMNAEFEGRAGDYLQPIQRAFHISRVREFEHLTLQEIRERFGTPRETGS